MPTPSTARRPRSWRPLAAVLAGAGVMHFVAPKVYAPLIPRQLGRPEPWVFWSGVAEVACAAALTVPAARPAAANATAALFVGVFPGNVQMAVSALASSTASPGYKAVALARLPLQVPLVLWARRVARASAARG